MIVGQFAADDRGYIRTLVSVPEFNVAARFWFVLDTGADRSLMSEHRLVEVGAGLEQLRSRPPDRTMAGVGGRIEVWTEPALFTLVHTDRREESFATDLHIVRAREGLPMPSILGRDLFDNFRITYHRAADLLTLE